MLFKNDADVAFSLLKYYVPPKYNLRIALNEAITEAATRGNAELIEILLHEKGPNHFISSDAIATAIQNATGLGNREVVRQLLLWEPGIDRARALQVAVDAQYAD